MSQQKKQWSAIIMMIALFAMIAFVTNLCNPMATILKNQFAVSNVLAQVGNYGNYMAYLLMGIPSGMLIRKIGYKKTAMAALIIGIIGLLFQWYSGMASSNNFLIYLIGAFVAGCTMCMLNTVVNPMLNLLGGGGNNGNQLIQIGGTFNSAAAVACYIVMGALVGDAAKAKISDATPALMLAIAIFAVALIVIAFTKIEEPKSEPVQKAVSTEKDPHSAFSFRHFNLGILAIFMYMGVEIGVPNYVNQYLTTAPDAATPGLGMDTQIAGLIVAVYFLFMMIGRFTGGVIGSKVSAKMMLTITSGVSIILTLFGMFAPTSVMVTVPGIDWANLSVITAQVPVGIFAFLLVGICASVMWGSIFNLATEGLGKYTAIASGAFMTMVFGCAIFQGLQAFVADFTGSFLTSYWVVVLCAAYILFYALIGYKNVNTDIPVE
uniref:MFS transporter n=2 Tax=unclassified Prevotella TaxID=2638335 RepID=A0AB33J7U4_9BACT